MAWAWEKSPYDKTQLLIHLALGDHANDEGVCWPAQKVLAKKGRCSERYVRTTIYDMKERGYLEIRQRPGTSNVYQLRDPLDVGVVPGSPDPGGEDAEIRNPGTVPQEEPSRTVSEPPPFSSDTFVSDQHDAVEPEYVDNIDDQWAGESAGKKRPKWQTPTADMMKYMAPFGRKWLRTRAERSKCGQLATLLKADLITEEWIENVLSWATVKVPGGGTRWSFDGFLNLVIDTERYRDWQIRYDNAKRDGEDASFDPTNLEHLQARYRE
jgi:hypothetical protein